MTHITLVMVDWLKSVCGNEYLVTIIVSMIPMIETRGAITIATSLGMNPWVAFIISTLSAMIVCPILLICLKPILKLLKRTKLFRKIAAAVEMTFVEKAEKIEKDAEMDCERNSNEILSKLKNRRDLRTAFGIFIFVAIPLPMTGVWTGTAIAAFIDLKFRYSIPAIVLGNFTAGFIITLLNIFLAEYSIWILLVLAVFMLIAIISLVTGFVIKYKKAKKTHSVTEENIK